MGFGLKNEEEAHPLLFEFPFEKKTLKRAQGIFPFSLQSSFCQNVTSLTREFITTCTSERAALSFSSVSFPLSLFFYYYLLFLSLFFFHLSCFFSTLVTSIVCIRRRNWTPPFVVAFSASRVDSRCSCSVGTTQTNVFLRCVCIDEASSFPAGRAVIQTGVQVNFLRMKRKPF